MDMNESIYHGAKFTNEAELMQAIKDDPIYHGVGVVIYEDHQGCLTVHDYSGDEIELPEMLEAAVAAENNRVELEILAQARKAKIINPPI